MQQIVHGLRTRGSMDFDEISRVVPWINMAHDIGIDIYAPQVTNPKAFKTHSTLDEVPKGGKYIVVLRDPKDALISHYHFFENFFFEKGSIDLETFAKEHYIPGRDVYKHINAMWGQHKDENVLAMCFEDMKQDLAGTIERVAGFIGIPLDKELMDIAVKQSEIKFMQEHKDQFEDHLVRKARSGPMKLPLDGKLNKVRNGQVGDANNALSDETKQELDKIWREDVTPTTGLNSYDELREELAM